MNYLKYAKTFARQAESVGAELMQAYAQLAIANAVIAIAEELKGRSDWKSIDQQLVSEAGITTAEAARRLNENIKDHLIKAVDDARL